MTLPGVRVESSLIIFVVDWNWLLGMLPRTISGQAVAENVEIIVSVKENITNLNINQHFLNKNNNKLYFADKLHGDP